MKAMKDEPLEPDPKIDGLPELKPRAVKEISICAAIPSRFMSSWGSYLE